MTCRYYSIDSFKVGGKKSRANESSKYYGSSPILAARKFAMRVIRSSPTKSNVEVTVTERTPQSKHKSFTYEFKQAKYAKAPKKITFSSGFSYTPKNLRLVSV